MYKLYLTQKELVHTSILLVAIICVALLPVALGTDLTKIYSPYILAIYIILGTLIFLIHGSTLTFLSPNSLVFFYVTISLMLGSIAFNMDAVLVARNLAEYERHQHTAIALTFILLGLAFMPVIEVTHKRVWLDKRTSPILGYSHLLIILCVALPLIFGSIDLSIIGGSGSLSPYLASLTSVACLAYASSFSRTIRYLIYMGIFALMVAIYSNDKRLAIFLLFVVLFLEARRGALVFNLKGVLFVSCGLLVAIYAILVMSINRGYGSFIQDGGVIEASNYVFEYVGSDLFLAGFFQNIEVSYFYFHYLNAAELVLSRSVELSYGSTLVKPLFIPFPREIIPWKPDSIIDLYTMAHDPGFRSIGGSWPANFAAEYLWNFHFIGLLLFGVFAKLNAWFYRVLVSPKNRKAPYISVLMLFTYMNILTYARGSGLDLLVFSLIVVGAITLLAALVHSLLKYKPNPQTHVLG